MSTPFKIIECPRDAMQGISTFIPTAEKIEYINALLEVGFDTIDFGSFVSPKAVPQLVDTREVLSELTTETRSKLLAIIVNERGAEDALQHKRIDQLGYPMSISETFQQRNSRKSIAESMNDLQRIVSMVQAEGKEIVVYISMGFGNPYGDAFSTSHLIDFTSEVKSLGVKVISIADTVGIAGKEQISEVMSAVIKAHPDIEIGAHLHSVPLSTAEKVQAAINAGTKRIDGALGGFGGCPFADDALTGNVDTHVIIEEVLSVGKEINLNMKALEKASGLSARLFGRYH